MFKLLGALILALILAAPVVAQEIPVCGAASLLVGGCDVQSREGVRVLVRDGATSTDCATGGGANRVVCVYNGSLGWLPELQLGVSSGTAPAAVCIVGTIFLDTDETVDTNCTTTNDNSLCLCTAANTWVQLNNN